MTLLLATSPEPVDIRILSVWEDEFLLPNFDTFMVQNLIFRTKWGGDEVEKKEGVPFSLYLHGKLGKKTERGLWGGSPLNLESANFIENLMEDMNRLDKKDDELPMLYDLKKTFKNEYYICDEGEPFKPGSPPIWRETGEEIQTMSADCISKATSLNKRNEKFEEITKLIFECDMEEGRLYAIRWASLIKSFHWLPPYFHRFSENHRHIHHFYTFKGISEDECKKVKDDIKDQNVSKVNLTSKDPDSGKEIPTCQLFLYRNADLESAELKDKTTLGRQPDYKLAMNPYSSERPNLESPQLAYRLDLDKLRGMEIDEKAESIGSTKTKPGGILKPLISPFVWDLNLHNYSWLITFVALIGGLQSIASVFEIYYEISFESTLLFLILIVVFSALISAFRYKRTEFR